jgi:hypothetical protein
MSRPATASSSEAEWTPAARALNRCSLWRKPPTTKAIPSTSSRLPRIDPINEAFTIRKLSALISRTHTISAVMYPKVAFTSPPRRGPIRAATCSVERPMRPASGTMAKAEVMKTTVG